MGLWLSEVIEKMKRDIDENKKQNQRINTIKKTSFFIWIGYFILTVALEYYLNIHLHKPGILSVLGSIVMLLGIVITYVAGDILFKQNFT